MKLPWYGMWTNFPRHAKTRALCAALRDDNAGMYVVRLLSHCAEEALDGRVSSAAVEGIAEWKKRRGVLLAALLATGFLEAAADGMCIVHGWEERNGARIRKALADNARPNATRREKMRGPASTPPQTDAGRERDPEEAPTKPRAGSVLGDGRSETEETAAAAAREAREGSSPEASGADRSPAADSAALGSEVHVPGIELPEPSASDAGGTLRPAPAARGHSSEAATYLLHDDDLPPPPKLTVVDATDGWHPVDEGPSYPLGEELRRRVIRALKLETLQKLQGRDEELKAQLEAKIARVGMERAEAACVARARSYGRPIGSMKLYAQVVLEMADEAQAAALDPKALRDEAIAQAEATCAVWARLLKQAAKRVPLGEFVQRLAPIRARLEGRDLVLALPNPRLLEPERERLEELATEIHGAPVRVRLVMQEPPRAAGARA